VSLFGCSADVDESATSESLSGQSAPLIIVGDCTFSDGYASTCLGKGGYLTCDGGTSMCCKDSKSSRGGSSTFCAANVDEIKAPPTPPPAPTVLPGEPGLDKLK
jgi:hypothetical protein